MTQETYGLPVTSVSSGTVLHVRDSLRNLIRHLSSIVCPCAGIGGTNWGFDCVFNPAFLGMRLRINLPLHRGAWVGDILGDLIISLQELHSIFQSTNEEY